jgi:hypothetical protein
MKMNIGSFEVASRTSVAAHLVEAGQRLARIKDAAINLPGIALAAVCREIGEAQLGEVDIDPDYGVSNTSIVIHSLDS